MRQLTMIVSAAAVLNLGVPSFGRTLDGGAAGKDIVDTAIAAGNFETLVQAVKAAGLVDTLKSDGPFTVFAPTDAAFESLPDGVLKGLLDNPAELAAVLKYHVVAGRVTSSQVVKMQSASTVLGRSLSISSSHGVRVDDAKVIQADILTSNGVIHVIDKVLIPNNDIVEVARSAGSFKTLLAAVDAAGLTNTLRGEGPFTVFAPTDEAFGKLPEGTVEALLADIPRLKSILTYHVVAGRVLAKDVAALNRAETLEGSEVKIDTSSGVRINDARVIKADVAASNGVIHVVDEVLLPPAMRTSDARPTARTLIMEAINRGVPLFNDGHAAACAAVYEVAALGLLAMPASSLSTGDRGTLADALRHAENAATASRRAWIMRHALDEVYRSSSTAMEH